MILRLRVLVLCLSLLPLSLTCADEVFPSDVKLPLEQKAEELFHGVGLDLSKLAEMRLQRKKFDLNDIAAYGEYNRNSERIRQALEKKLADLFIEELNASSGYVVLGSPVSELSPGLRSKLEDLWHDLKLEFERTETELEELEDQLHEIRPLPAEVRAEMEKEHQIKEELLETLEARLDGLSEFATVVDEELYALVREISSSPPWLDGPPPLSNVDRSFCFNISELFITGGGLDKAYERGVKTSILRKVAQFDIDNATIYSTLGLEHSVLFREDVNVNPIPGINHVTIGNAQTYGGVVGTGIRFHEFNLFEGFPLLSDSNRPLPYLDLDFNLGVGAFHQDLGPQVFNASNPSIKRGPGTPRGDGPYVNGEIKTKLGFAGENGSIGITGSYFMFGTDAVNQGWNTTNGYSLGVEVELYEYGDGTRRFPLW